MLERDYKYNTIFNILIKKHTKFYETGILIEDKLKIN